jgi:hypothetical protein
MEYQMNLRKLEICQAILKEVASDPTRGDSYLASFLLADDESLKLYSTGNKEVMSVFVEKAMVMDPEEVATLIANFTLASSRYTLVKTGYTSEEVNQTMAMMKAKQASLLQEGSALMLEVMKQL